MNIGTKEAAEFLRDHDNYLIYTHASPDADTIGSACALCLILRSMGKTASAVNPEKIPRKLDFLPINEIFTDIPENTDGFTLVSVDVASAKMLVGTKVPKFALSIDHHRVNTIDCGLLCDKYTYIAAGEIIFEIMKELDVALTKEIAFPLYAAICSDSGGFRYDATRPETHITAAELIKTGIDFSYICRRLFESKSMNEIALIRIAYSKIKLLRNGQFAYIAITPEEFKESGAEESDFDAINLIPREIENVKASAVIREKNGMIKISMRSNDMIDMAAIAKANGGGGHYHAAGFSVKGTIEEACELIERIFGEIKTE